MPATVRQRTSATVLSRLGRRSAWALAAVLILMFGAVSAVFAAGGDHGACGADWVKFDYRGGDTWVAEWSAEETFTVTPEFTVTEWKDDNEPITIEWTNEDPGEPIWTVSAVWLKAGSEESEAAETEDGRTVTATDEAEVAVVAVLDVVDVLPETLPATGVPVWALAGMSISALVLGTLLVRRPA